MKFRIKERREQLKMKQRDLVAKTGLSRAQISVLENGGDVDMKVSSLIAIATALRCSPSSLFAPEVHSDRQGETE